MVVELKDERFLDWLTVPDRLLFPRNAEDLLLFLVLQVLLHACSTARRLLFSPTSHHPSSSFLGFIDLEGIGSGNKQRIKDNSTEKELKWLVEWDWIV